MNSDRPMSAIAREVLGAFYGLAKSELRLAQAELRSSARETARGSATTIVGAALLFFGALTLVAFAVIGLGLLIQDRYWLSALIIGGALLIAGGVILKTSMRAIKQGASLGVVRQNIASDRELAQQKVQDLSIQVRDSRRRIGA